MRRVCFIGSSHVGCMKLGVEAARAAGKLDGIDVTVFGTSGDKLKFSTVGNARLSPTNRKVQEEFKWTSGGQSEIPLADFDEFYLFAGLPPTCIDAFVVRDPLTGLFDVPVMSDAMLAQSFASLREGWHIRMAEEIAEERPDAQVTFVGRPFRSEDSPFAKRMVRKLWGLDRGFAKRVDRARQAIAAYCADSGRDNLTFAFPAPHLLEKNGFFTKSKYGRGSLRLSEDRIEHPKDDFSHMNGEYGEEMVLHLLKPAA